MSAYETVTAADLRVGDVFRILFSGEYNVTRAVSHPGNSTVWIQHTNKGGTLSGTYGITHPFERLIVPTTESELPASTSPLMLEALDQALRFARHNELPDEAVQGRWTRILVAARGEVKS